MTRRALLVATPGGHIDELYDLVPRLAIGTEHLWVTAETPQTARLLVDEETEWVPPIASRQAQRALARLPQALSLIRRYRPDSVISTGAALATPYLVASRFLGVETHYIESATRLDGPSLTGRIVARLPGAKMHHQGFRSPVAGWHSVGSVFDAYAPGDGTEQRLRRAVVILGTERYPFTRCLAEVARAMPSGVEVLYQTGNTPVPSPGTAYRKWIPSDELICALEEADLVISHAGVGSVLTTLRLGKHPLVIPRLADLGEHVDDHQSELARMLEARGLVTVAWDKADLAPLLTRAAQLSTTRAMPRSIVL